MAETAAKFLACFYSSGFVSLLAFVSYFFLEVKLPKVLVLELVLSISEPRETPLPLKAENELFFSSSGADLDGAPPMVCV